MPLPSTNLLCRYYYDPLDQLISQTVHTLPGHQRFYCKNRLVTEIQGATNHSIFHHGGHLLAQQEHEGNDYDTLLLTTDQQRSILHTIQSNQPPEPVTYSPYGHRPPETALTRLLGFNGERSDPLTGHYSLGNGHREYNPVLMRFNSPDILSPFGKGGLNTYVYCLDDPINLVDPNGTAPIIAWFRAWFTGTARIAPGGTPLKIKSGVSTKMAMKQRDESFKALASIDRVYMEQNAKFQYDIAHQDKLLNRLNVHDVNSASPEMGNKAVNYMLQRADEVWSSAPGKDSRFFDESIFNLEDLANGEHKVAPIELHHRMAEKLARNYHIEMLPQSLEISHLTIRAKSIRDSYFVG